MNNQDAGQFLRMNKNKIVSSLQNLESTAEKRLNNVALSYIQEAWDEAILDGLEPEMLVNAAHYAAFCDLVDTYGEDAVASMAEGLSKRIQHGEFTVNRITQ